MSGKLLCFNCNEPEERVEKHRFTRVKKYVCADYGDWICNRCPADGLGQMNSIESGIFHCYDCGNIRLHEMKKIK